MDFFWHAFDFARHILLQCFKVGWTILQSTEFSSALGGAFFGATAAAWFESKRRRREKRDREYEALLRTQAVIISQGNSLAWIAKLYPSDDSFNNYQTVVLGFTRQMLDFKDLAFIAKSSDPQLLIDLDVANERYDFFRRLLESRNATIQEFLRHPETKITNLDVTTGKFTGSGLQLLEFNVRQTNSAASRSLANAKARQQRGHAVLADVCTKGIPGTTSSFSAREHTIIGTLSACCRNVSLLDDITAQGTEVRTHLRQLFRRHEYPPDTKTFLLRAYVDIAFEHHDAIWLLAKCRLNGSAFAMVRAVYDAMFRAFWINNVATEQQREQATRDELGFPLEKILVEIKRDYFSDRPPEEAELFDSFLQLIKEAWGPMCSYTHSGALQLARRFTGDELKPDYSEGATAEALNLVTVALLLLLHTFFVSMKCQQEAEETGTMLLQWNFGARLRAAAKAASAK